MRPNIYNYRESISNPNGHFKSLEKLFALRDSDGDPHFTVASKIARFDVEWRGKRSLLCCFLGNPNVAKARYKILALQMESLQSKFLTPWQYLEKEMLVFDERGDSRSYDIIIQQEPDGETLDNFIRRCCKQSDTHTLRLLLSRVCEMAIEFYESGFVHGAISPANIIVTHDAIPVMINYRSSYVLDLRSNVTGIVTIDEDNLNLAILAIVLYVTSMQPHLYAEFKGIMAFRKPNLRRALPRLYDIANVADIEPVKNIVSAILNANDKLKDREQLHEFLFDLSACDMNSAIEQQSSLQLLKDELMWASDQVVSTEPTIEILEDKPLDNHTDLQMPQMEWVSKVSDTLVCAKGNDKRWYYYNKDGTKAFDGAFEMGEDFVEGRAVVMLGDCYGIINRDGQFIIEPVCEDMVWYGEYGVVVVSTDGHYELRNRDGELITTDEYDWLGILEEELIPAKLGELYGYINLKGEIAIDFIYDDAYSFSNGCALVSKDGSEFEINRQGKRV